MDVEVNAVYLLSILYNDLDNYHLDKSIKYNDYDDAKRWSEYDNNGYGDNNGI